MQSIIRSASCVRLLRAHPSCLSINPYRASTGGTKRGKEPSKRLVDLPVREVEPEGNIYGKLGEEITGKKLNKHSMIEKLNEFYQTPAVRQLAESHLIHEKLFKKAFDSFRRYCVKSDSLPPELYVKICDIIGGHGHVTDIYPFFLKHARDAFPHLECHEELRKISNLGKPHSWYPLARSIDRKIIFHAGPTNSGKTYHAMKRFLESESGVYCGPLKLLATEIFNKSNEYGTPCDLVTGEERRFANGDETPSKHVSCTVEMAHLNAPVEVAIIDEIQMLRDPTRGWAWNRALLGIPAKEVHICGEEAALDVLNKIITETGERMVVERYKRLTPLVIEDEALMDFKNVRPGDCVVCFTRDNVYGVARELEKLGHKVAVIYGTLPPETKMQQCKKFNDQEECQVMVATDAIGMGLNLSIRRIIFYSLMKTSNDEHGNLSYEYITTSLCLQIAGRAGRFGTLHSTGYVTTYRPEDLRYLREIMSRAVPSIDRAGLHPTAEQIELFSYHLPHLTLCDLIDLFVDLCEFDAKAFFICDLENFKFLASKIQHINLPLKSRFLFCSAPINIRSPFAVAIFTKYVRQYSIGEPVTVEWVKRTVGWPLANPVDIKSLTELEGVFDAFEVYLWLSYRFGDIFPEPNEMRALQKQLDAAILEGLSKIVNLDKSTRVPERHIKRLIREVKKKSKEARKM